MQPLSTPWYKQSFLMFSGGQEGASETNKLIDKKALQIFTATNWLN